MAKKSERLKREEHERLIGFLSIHGNITEMKNKYGFRPNTLDRVRHTGSGSPETIRKIREHILENSNHE